MAFDDCLAFLDYILTPRLSDKEVVSIFKMLDRNGIGHIATNDVLSLLRKELTPQDYERYSQIISTYGSSINYIDLFQKHKIR